MSRYLEYSDPAVSKFQGEREVRERPKRRLSICIAGPEPEFKAYLTKGYKGSSIICCGGRFAVGQLWPNSLSTVVMTLGPGFIYFQYLLPQVVDSPFLDSFLGVSQSVLGALILIAFILASFVNPGIVPRCDTVPKELSVNYFDPHNKPMPRFLQINNITVKQKFCNTCNIFRPPRSKHCQFCDNCVLRFDHHCTWLGNCVGLHNYRFFVCLIYSSTLFLIECIYVVCCIFRKKTGEKYGSQADILDWLSVLWGNLFLVVFQSYCLVLFIAVLLLSVYHTVISLQNLTTNEHVKNYYRENPFDFGPAANCSQIYFHPERVVAKGPDVIKADYDMHPSYSEDGSFDEFEKFDAR